MRIIDCDYFVVGSGMSGLMTALHLAPAGKTVLVTEHIDNIRGTGTVKVGGAALKADDFIAIAQSY